MMERLTKNDNGTNIIAECRNELCKETCDRVSGCKECPIAKAIDRLSEYEEAEDKGLLLRLPCKVGDKVWDNDFGMPCSYEVTGFSYKNLNEDDNDDDYEDEIVVHYKNFNGSITGRFAASEIGKTVFLTKEQAEQALAEMKIN